MIVVMKNKGFTFIELMVTIAIAAILMAVAAPNFTSMMINQSVDRDRDALFSLLLGARTEAINRGRTVTVCSSSDMVTCKVGAVAITSDWSDGWIVFFDTNGNGVVEAGNNDFILKVNEALQSEVSLGSSAGGSITFNSLGRTLTPSTFTFTHVSGDADFQRQVIVTTTGRVRKG